MVVESPKWTVVVSHKEYSLHLLFVSFVVHSVCMHDKMMQEMSLKLEPLFPDLTLQES